MENTVTVVKMKVSQNLEDLLYYVLERKGPGDWEKASKGYKYPTSAYAALGRIVEQECA